MKKALFILLALLIISCKKSESLNLKLLTKDNISGSALWNRITKETNYENYSYWPEHEGLHPGQSPHGTLHKIYVNNRLLAALPSADRIAPYGSIIVKENYTPDEILDKLTVMIKVKDYNPDGGDWFFAAISSDGKVLKEGVPKGCFSCHEGMRDNDYIIVRELDK